MLRSSRVCSYLVASFASAILLCAFCLQVVQGAYLSVIVNPSSGIDSSSCNLHTPCKTIAYAIHSRNANSVYLAAGYFNESNVIINSSSPFVSIFGSNDSSSSTVFDCNGRSSSGPAFSIFNTAVSISGITFQNCANFDGLNEIRGVGGAVSASGSIVTVSDCKFFNNSATIGGAIGVRMSSLVVSSCVFEKNTATCPNAASTATACSAWGGAIGTEESPSVSIIGNSFNSNSVNLVLNGVTSPTSKAVGGGGCISVMHKGNVSESRVTIDGNSLQSCSVQLFGFNNGSTTQGIQFGNAYGGAVSLYYGLEAVDSLVVRNARSAFVNNQCRSSSITSSVGIGGNSYGGCLSVYVGAWNMNTEGDSSIGSLTMSSTETNISGNTITNCRAQRFGILSNGANVYGGGISVAVGAYSYSFSLGSSSSSTISGSTTVSNSSYSISSNTLTNCSAASSGSGAVSAGSNVYGGGISVAVGAYSYSFSRSSYSISTISGSTTVSSTSYFISSNTVTNCSATSSGSGTFSAGSNVYGGGISVAVGAYSYSISLTSSSISNISGSTTVSIASYSISSNTLTSCSAASSGSGAVSAGSNVYGGGISVAVGAYSYSFSRSSRSSSTISGSTTVSNSSYTISINALTNCSATSLFTGGFSSNGANVYGGGISVAVGAYSYSFSLGSSSSSKISGSTTVSNTSYSISSNTLTNCSATSSGSGAVSAGSNVYGGGISVAVGAYSYSLSGSSSDVSSTISGSTTVSSTSYSISSNTLTNCSAISLFTGSGTFGSNVYGGGISVAVGAYSYSFSGSSGDVSSTISGSTTVSNTSYSISSNTLTNCSATSSGSGAVSAGSNVYGGGISVAVGAYSYSYCSSSSDSRSSSISTISGSTTVSNTSYSISSNTLTNCSVTSSRSGGSSNGANMYGGGISVAVGAYSYSVSGSNSYSISTISGSTTVSSTSYTISSNTLTKCSATSSGSSSNGANVYGGGISVAVGANSYSFCSSSSFSSSRSISNVSGSTTVSSTSYAISNNTLTNCSATSLFTVGFSKGSNVYGGGISVTLGAFSYSVSSVSSSISSCSTISGSTTVSNASYTISSNTVTNCSATSSVIVGSSNGANVYGGGISVAVGAYSYSISLGSSSISNISGSTTVSIASYSISSNTLTNCSAASSGSGAVSAGSNVYGGGISVAVGAYSYSLSGSSSDVSSTISGSTTVSNSSYTISSNTLTKCSATSSGSGGSSNGANVYGGGISVAVGAYSYSLSGSSYSISTISGSTTVSNTSYAISSNNVTKCNSLSQISGTSNAASAYGGAFSVVHNASSFPLSSVQSVAEAIGVSSVLRVDNCSFLQSTSTTSSTTCASGGSNAAGGAVFALVPSLDVDVLSSSFSYSRIAVQCAAFSTSTYSLGGALSIFQAGNVNVTSTNFTRCYAQGVPQSTNVFVSGGGLHIQASDSFLFQNGFITNCSVRDAFSTLLQSGGGALSTQNVSVVQISHSIFRDNSDSSSSGSIVLQQLQDDRGMNVTMNRSLVLIEPSETPAFNVSCGSNCSQSQQQRINIRLKKFNISAYSGTLTKQYDFSAMMTLPTLSVVDSDRNSSLNCLFNFTSNVAILITNTGAAFVTFSCAPCSRPFEIAQTSHTLELSNFQNVTNLGQRLCQSTSSIDLQQCPFGVPLCSTIVNVSVGFWASFSADGKLGDATRCPRNYCGCRNYPDYNNSRCLLEPPFSPMFQSDVRTNDNLCNGNRSGVLCGGCKPGFTQSLDGCSCISNDACSQNVRWTWAVSIIGYAIYSLYMVMSSLQASKLGLIKCVLFYGQMSSFVQLDLINARSQSSESSSVSSWLPRVSQFESISSLSSKACYGTDIGAYHFTALQLYGPAIVLMFALAFALVSKQVLTFLQRYSIFVEVSMRATVANVMLLIFSSVSTVVFKLVTCSKIVIENSTDDVVFIDGTMKCYDEKWKGLIAVVVLLCAVPFLFAAALHFRWLPQHVQMVVCGAYSESRYYWGAVTLFFRLAMSIMFSTIRDTPSTAALIQCFFCVTILVLLVNLKPYCHAATYFFDIFCHAILVVQFGLMAIGTVSDSLGLVPSNNNRYYDTLNRAAEATLYLR